MDEARGTPTTLQEAVIHFANYENCHNFMVTLRWPDGKIQCPRCGSFNVSYLPNARVFKCYEKHERQKFSLKVGTIFEDSPIPLEKWLPVMWLLVNCKNGVSSWEIHRAIGVTQKSAWFMLQRGRLAMQDESKGGKLGGEVEVDETFIGGKARNMHKDRKRRVQKHGRNTGGKAIVLGMLERGKTVRAAVIEERDKPTMQSNIRENVETGSQIYSDEFGSGWRMDGEYDDDVINHLEAYVNGNIHTNGMENFWSLLKRGLHGTYVSVEPFHLFRYVDEQAFRYNNRKPMDDGDRFKYVMRKIVGKRLTYAELTGKTEAGPRTEEVPF
jgi:transposase-like protein